MHYDFFRLYSDAKMKTNLQKDIKFWLIVVVIISVIFNLFYVGGVITKKIKDSGRAEVINKIFEQIEKTGGVTITNDKEQALFLVPVQAK